jgi:hypothetical protein
MASINVINYNWVRLAVEVDGEAVAPIDIFNSSNLNLEMLKRLNPQAPVRHQIARSANDWDLKTLEEQYTLTFDDIKEALKNYVGEKNPDIEDPDIGYSLDPLPSNVEPASGAMSTYYEGGSTMNITKGRLKQIIQEELARRNVVEGHDDAPSVQTELARMVLGLLEDVEDSENWKEHHTMVMSNELRSRFEDVARQVDDVQRQLDFWKS